MRKFEITFKKIKTQDVLKSVIIESETDLGIMLKGCIEAQKDVFIYNRHKHKVSFKEVE